MVNLQGIITGVFLFFATGVLVLGGERNLYQKKEEFSKALIEQESNVFKTPKKFKSRIEMSYMTPF